MISDNDMRAFAELLVSWAESELTARATLSDGGDRHQRDHAVGDLVYRPKPHEVNK
jgi:hypothetical protein